MSFVLVLSLVAFSPIMGTTRSEAKSHRLKMYALPTVKNIKIIISKGKKASYYKIYRAKVSKKSYKKLYEYAGCKDIPMKNFTGQFSIMSEGFTYSAQEAAEARAKHLAEIEAKTKAEAKEEPKAEAKAEPKKAE